MKVKCGSPTCTAESPDFSGIWTIEGVMHIMSQEGWRWHDDGVQRLPMCPRDANG